MKDLVIVGAGGHGREILQCVIDINEQRSRWNVLGFVDDGDVSLQVDGYPLLGTTRWLEGRECHVVVAIGAPAVRRRVVDGLKQMGVSCFATLVHPSALVGRSVVLGEGTMVCMRAVLTTDIVLGQHVVVNTAAVISHDTRLADFSTVAPHGCVCGDVSIEEGADLGAASTILPGVRVGAWAVVGAGATVLEDVADNEVLVGSPGRSLRTKDMGWQA